MRNTKHLRKTYVRLIFPALAASMMLGSAAHTTSVQAQSESTLPVFNFSITDSNLIGDLKAAVIKDRVANDETLDLNTISIEKSTLDVDGLDRTSTALQTVTLKVTLYTESESGSETSLGYSFTQDAVVKLDKDSAPTIVLKSDTVTVNNGDSWNPYAYFASIHDSHGNLPVIKEEDNVDMTTDGTYTATYTAVALDGTSSSSVLTVVVKTPDEVIKAREEAARKAAEEEAKRQEEERRQREEEERKEEEERRQREEEERRQQLNNPGNGNPVYGDGWNPYYGGWSNCTWSAWELANAYTGVSMPNFGNASGWAYTASSYGYGTGSTPVAGSIAVYSNHVAYVAAVSADGSSVYIMEGGVNGGYYERWVSAWGTGSQSLQSYIYLN